MATVKIALPFLESGQANKELKHNEALVRIDAMVQPRIIDKDATAPPGSPADGDCYIVASGGSGLWSGHDNDLAVWCTESGIWLFFDAQTGLIVYVIDEALYYKWSGSAWVLGFSFLAQSAADGITASATQTQAGATVLTAQCSRITTCATLGNSVRAPTRAVQGLSLEVRNDGAQSAWFWPMSGDAIDAAAVDARDATAITAASVRRYRCYTTGTWRTV